MKKQVIVARYKENIDWVRELECDHIIYDKSGIVTNDDLNRFYLEDQEMGREAHTYLYHIVKNYHNLADYNYFVQGHPFDHCGNVLDIIKNHPHINCIPLGYMHWVKVDQLDLFYCEGAQFMVTKQCIHVYPLSFYEECYALSFTNAFAGHHFEFMWMTIWRLNKYIAKETAQYIDDNHLIWGS